MQCSTVAYAKFIIPKCNFHQQMVSAPMSAALRQVYGLGHDNDMIFHGLGGYITQNVTRNVLLINCVKKYMISINKLIWLTTFVNLINERYSRRCLGRYPTANYYTVMENTMITIKILGCGETCQKLLQATQKAIEALGIEAEIKHLMHYDEISVYPIVRTPGLVINDVLVASGRVPMVSEIKSWLS